MGGIRSKGGCEMESKKLPVGIDSFEKLRREDFYYIDKTGLIRDLLNNWGEVNLFTRPRRFGKTLNMSMLKSFFEIGADKTLFDGLAISKETALCEAYMGKFPVVFVSLKGVDGLTFEDAYEHAAADHPRGGCRDRSIYCETANAFPEKRSERPFERNL